ncbi:MAG: 16S rRNA (cytidine(1402)-2'-O)-methyltransferase [Erysipelotrichaceae bacterium]|nr:16S rRNA (cytidine(1402)-2'-O)-methyltransferase [Erysipelotrichaceae bacterium]
MKRNKNFVDEKPLLYLLATPIGNLKELSPRAIEVLNAADLIACEDTRNTFSLLSHFGIKKNLVSLREHNEKAMSQKIVNDIKEGKKVVYVSDAGYPCISDPGSILAKECLANDINVSTISGSSAFINALVSSGLDSDHFYFYGFLSSKDSEAKKELEKLKSFTSTIIFYESPHRIERTLSLLNQYLGNREAVIARELTKKNEEYIRGTLDELVNIDPSSIIGEIVIVVEGNNKQEDVNEEKIIEHIKLLLEKGISKKDISEIISKIDNVNKNDVYNLAIKIK